MNTTPFWLATPTPHFRKLDRDIEVDVAVVGGGLTGITAAYLLGKSGLKVALLERHRCAAADTGHTTAHLTAVTDKRLHELARSFGKSGARAFWEAGSVAIDEIERIVTDENIDCDFRRVPGYLHAASRKPSAGEVRSIERDAKLASALGFRARLVKKAPYVGTIATRYDNQAKFHPRKYLAALLERIREQGGFVFEESEAIKVERKPLTVRVGTDAEQEAKHAVRCGFVVIATHSPIAGATPLVRATLFQTKLSLYTSYVVGARIPKGSGPEVLLWDTGDPYSYVRVDRLADHDYAIVGGNDNKTGQGNDLESFTKTEAYLRKLFPDAEVTHRWMGQVIETNDGLPFMGEIVRKQFVATGFCGNGFTLGTAAALMVRDQLIGRENPWRDLFDVKRRKLLGGTWRYLTENVDYPFFLIRDSLKRPQARSLKSVARGTGKLVEVRGKKRAVYRDSKGKVHTMSPICTHMGCTVRWNAADKSWDCPCHGSRFTSTGAVIGGPAEKPLK